LKGNEGIAQPSEFYRCMCITDGCAINYVCYDLNKHSTLMLYHRNRDGRRGSKKAYLRRVALNGATFFVTALVILVPLEPAFAQSGTDGSSNQNANSVTSGILPPGSEKTDTNVDALAAQPSTTGNAETPASAATQSAAADSGAPVAGTGNSPAPAGTPPGGGIKPINPTVPNIPNKNSTGPSPEVSSAPDLQPTVYSSFNQNQLKIDQNTGALETTYPITLPPGRNNLQPDLDLVYNSENSQQGSIFGEGWSISIPYISRLNLTGVENLYSTSTPNYFTSSLDGELSTTTVSGDYIARTENGTFDQYTFSKPHNLSLLSLVVAV
jgi:Salmonella virulence plasmid 65kDa B protein